MKIETRLLNVKGECIHEGDPFYDKGNQPIARSLGRRLNKLSHWIPKDTPELTSFRQFQAEGNIPKCN